MIAIILAGGFGTRLKSVVSDRPKSMALIRGKPFLEYQMDYWIEQGVTQFILSVGYLREMIIGHFGRDYHGASVEYAIEERPLGTGGGLILAADGLVEPFLVLNGDTFIDVNLDELYKFHQKQMSEWTFSLFRTSQSGRYMGIDVAANGEIIALQSMKNRVACLVNGGCYLVSPSILDRLRWKVGDKVSLEDELLPDFISVGGALYGME